MKNSTKKLPPYVLSEDNPEDVATRPCRPKDTKRWNLWTKGPKFLYDIDVLWLKTSLGLSDEDCEVVPTACSVSTVSRVLNENGPLIMAYTLDCTNKLTKALKVVNAVLRCFNKWKQQSLKTTINCQTSLNDFYNARNVLIRSAQLECLGQYWSIRNEM